MRKLANHKLLTNAAFLYLSADLIAKVIQFLILPFSSRVLNLDDYAEFTLILTLLTALVPLIGLSSESAYSMYFNRKKGYARTQLFFTCGFVSFCGFCFFILLTAVISSVDDSFPFQVLSLRGDVSKIILVSFLEYFIVLFLLESRLLFKPNRYFIDFILILIIKTIVSLSALYYSRSTSLYLNTLICVNSLFVLFFLYRRLDFKRDGSNKYHHLINVETLKQVLKLSLIIFPVTVFAVLNGIIDKVYVSSILSKSELASYTSMFLFASAINVFTLALNKAYVPILLKDYSSNSYEALANTENLVIRNLTIVFIVALLSVAIAPFLFNLFFHENIEFNHLVYTILVLSSAFNIIYIQYTNVLSLNISTARYKAFGFGIALLINLPLSYYCTLAYGLEGAAISTLISVSFAALTLGLFVMIKIKKNYLLFESISFSVLSACFCSIIYLWF